MTERDVPALLEHWRRPEIRRYLWDDVTIEEQVVRGVLERSDTDFARAGYGIWIMRPTEGPDPIGFCGLRLAEGSSAVEILFSLEPERWGQGLATEAGRAVLGFAFADLGLERVEGRADRPNAASIAALKRLGMTLVATTGAGSRRTDHYAVSREAFEDRPAP